jgi:hypothetical protein
MLECSQHRPESEKPERILKAISTPSKETAEMLAFSWIDTKEVRSPDSQAYAFLNDSERAVSAAILDALESYDVRPVVWSKREGIREELAA